MDKITFDMFMKNGLDKENEEGRVDSSRVVRDNLKEGMLCLPFMVKRTGEAGLHVAHESKVTVDGYATCKTTIDGTVRFNLYPEPRVVDLKDRAELEQCYNECHKNNYYVTFASDPMKMRLGFVCLTNADSVFYNYPVSKRN